MYSFHGLENQCINKTITLLYNCGNSNLSGSSSQAAVEISSDAAKGEYSLSTKSLLIKEH